LAFDVTYIRQQGQIAWDVGTYRMTVPKPDGSRKTAHGKYLTLWRRGNGRCLIVADAWSSDVPAPLPEKMEEGLWN
jgi:ketosteroid isomerase-like protein